jgi:hypothetical protein
MQRQSLPPWDDERAAEKLAESCIVSAGIDHLRRRWRDAEPEDMVVSEIEVVGTLKDAILRSRKTATEKPPTWAETWTFFTSLLEVHEPRQQRRRPRGRPKMTEAERRKKYPVHDAADEVPLIVSILSLLYPERRSAEVRRRAVEVAAIRHSVSFETLLLHVNRPRKDRRRIRHFY